MSKKASVTYIAHQEEVVVPWGSTSFLFKRDEAREIPQDLADALKNQPEKFLIEGE
jgi:hypothetical protein